LPARLTAEQAAWVLNGQSHDVPILVAARLLKLLGNPAQNAIKFFLPHLSCWNWSNTVHGWSR
jgi:hypothetical protein